MLAIVVAVAAGLAVVIALLASGSSSSPTAQGLALGSPASSAQGPRITVYGWQLSNSASDNNATVASEVKTRSCRISPGGPLLNLSHFALVLPDGKVFAATGSSFAPAPDDPMCLQGTVNFELPKDSRPRSVKVQIMDSTFRWDLTRSGSAR